MIRKNKFVGNYAIINRLAISIKQILFYKGVFVMGVRHPFFMGGRS